MIFQDWLIFGGLIATLFGAVILHLIRDAEIHSRNTTKIDDIERRLNKLECKK